MTRDLLDAIFEEKDAAWNEKIKALLAAARQVTPRSDRYTWYQISLWLSNDEELSRQRVALARSLGGDEEDGLEKVDRDLEALVYADDEKRQNKAMRKLTPEGDDDLAHIRAVLRGKSWEKARAAFIKNFTSQSFNPTLKDADDETVDRLWQTVWNAAHGGRYTNTPITQTVAAEIPTQDLQLSSGGTSVHLVYLPADKATKNLADAVPPKSLKQFWSEVNHG